MSFQNSETSTEKHIEVASDVLVYPSHQQALEALKMAPEQQVLETLLSQVQLPELAMDTVNVKALELAQSIRHVNQQGSQIQNLLQEFALSTEEGVVLMCLAEALLRVPDNLTADRLIRDKLQSGDWSSHLGQDDSLFVNASVWGLFLSGKLANFSKAHLQLGLGGLKKILANAGEPVIRVAMRQAMRVMGSQFVLGTDIHKAFKRGAKQELAGFRYSYDMLGEAARTQEAANEYYKAYADAIEAIAIEAAGKGPIVGAGISVKLSALHPRYEFSQLERVQQELRPKVLRLAQMAKAANIGFTIDAEEADRLDISLQLIESVFNDPSLGNWDGFGLAIQAYQKRAVSVADYIIDLCRKTGGKMMVRLVKGAYWDSEIKHGQIEGYDDYPVFTRKQSTDVSYQVCARKLLAARDVIYPQFATHNAYSVAYILAAAETFQGFEFQRLHGMGDGLYEPLMQEHGIPCRIYAPVGEHQDLLAYLVRRLLENGANSSFVNNIVDESVSLSSLLENPASYLLKQTQLSHPGIRSPDSIYAENRKNARGLDLSYKPHRDVIDQYLEKLQAELPLGKAGHDSEQVINPANGQIIGYWQAADAQLIEQALAKAVVAQEPWQAMTVQARAQCLMVLADSLQQELPALMALLIVEAGKTRQDAIAEVREAIDFCRYYAERALTLDSQAQARGVVFCISPWNFPLAIFLGQVVAALVAGNVVLAKPAEQTSLIAIRVLQLMQGCGFSEDAMQLLLGHGAAIAKQLLPAPSLAAVMFTGSTATAELIAQQLAQREGPRLPLIAETGGQNCLLVDSSALPEQLVDDVVNSAFRSAGQRCSALRVLFVQEEIADNVIAMIKGAMQELSIGDPTLLASDLGPVIDPRALEKLQTHCQRLSDEGHLLHACALLDNDEGYYCAPHLFEIDSLQQLSEEVFGPVLHIVRYQADKIDAVYRGINASGFGLTAGIHSRIQQSANDFAANIQAGNIYVNRNIVGAVVGVQPFGGRGLSGTGPKAGGPNYLTRLVSLPEPTLIQRTATINYQCKLQGCSNPEGPWLQLSFMQRLQHLGPLLSQLQKVMSTENADLITAFENIVQNYSWQAQRLQGPTGEENILLYEPRGRVVCVSENSSSAAWYFHVLCNVLAGNISLIENNSYTQPLIHALSALGLGDRVEARAFDIQALKEDFDFSAVCASGADNYLAKIERVLRQRHGAMLPLIAECSLTTIMPRLLLEKVISTDTTAAGGNASLLVLEA